MKKVFLAIMFAGVTAVYVQGQIYMGGSFNLSARSTDSDDKVTTNISLYPEIGYYLTDRWDIGLNSGIGYDSYASSANWLFSPYTRYSFIRSGKFELIGKASFLLEGGKNYFLLGPQVIPIVAYNLNEHIALQTNLNFISFGFSINKPKGGDATSNFNMGFNSNNVVSLGGLTIGFIYKF